MDEFIDEGAEAPPVDGPAVALLPDHLGGQVFGGPADRKGFLFGQHVVAGKPEVGHFDVALSVDQNVFGFKARWTPAYSR